MAGRPKKYKTRKALDAAVENYFGSITRVITLHEQVPSGKTDDKGHEIMLSVPITNRLGEEVKTVEYVVPPTVGGLCDALGISRSTWAEYCDETKHPEFSDTTTHARGRMRAWREEQLLTRPGKDVKGIIFDLENNYGYRERMAFGGDAEMRHGMGVEEYLRREAEEDDSDDF